MTQAIALEEVVCSLDTKDIERNKTKKEKLIEKYFSDVKDNIEQFSEWIIKKWFHPEKNLTSSWYNSKITSSSVIEYISNNLKFPYSPSQLIEIWKMSLRAKDMLQNYSSLLDEYNPEDKKCIYISGDVKLKEIGKEFNVTHTAIDYLTNKAENKIKEIYGTYFPKEITTEQEDEIIDFIDTARIEAVDDYIDMLNLSNGDLNSFLTILIKNNILSKNELEFITEDEKNSICLLYSVDEYIIQEVLLQDIEENDNVFKTFQNLVSMKAFPYKKRGRTKGTKNQPTGSEEVL